MRHATTLVATLVLAAPASADGEAKRLAQAVKEGDVAISKKVAARVVRYAMEAYGVDGDTKDVEKSLYAFLKWKLGSPTAIAGQWVTAGYGHFNKTYGDEAAAMMLGVFAFDEQEPELVIPEWLLDAIDIWDQEGSISLGATYFLGWGLAHEQAAKLTEGLRERLKEEVRNRFRMFVPKTFDVKDKLVEDALRARREQAASSPSSPGGLSLPERVRERAEAGRKPAPTPSRTTTSVEERLAAIERRLARIESLLEAAVRAGPAEDEHGEEEGVAQAGEGFDIEPNDAIRGRTGRLVVEFPESVRTHVAVARVSTPEETLAGHYGSKTFELLPGTYRVTVAGRGVDVPLRRGHDTRVHVGVLEIQLAARTYWEARDEEGNRVGSGYGSGSVGLLPGRYVVSVLDTEEPVFVSDGEVTKF